MKRDRSNRATPHVATAGGRPVRELSRRRTWLFTGLLVVLVPSVCLLAGEALVRILAPQQLTSDIIAPDPVVDYRLRPNAEGHMRSREFSVTVNVNSLGFRGEDVAIQKSPGTKRVIFLGDSFVFGHGLNDDETLPFQVGRELNRASPNMYEVINGGVYGYSTANEVDFFLEYGRPLNPDIVVIVLIPHDVPDNQAWYSLSPSGELIRKNTSSRYVKSRRITQYIPGARWLRAYSHLFKFVGVRILPVLTAGREARQTGPRKTPSPQRDFRFPEFFEDPFGQFATTAAILRKLALAADEIGAKTILLTMGLEVPLKETALLHEQLKKTALEIGFADAAAIPRILEQYDRQDDLFYPEDGHWTAAAVEFVAPEVARLIARTCVD